MWVASIMKWIRFKIRTLGHFDFIRKNKQFNLTYQGLVQWLTIITVFRVQKTVMIIIHIILEAPNIDNCINSLELLHNCHDFIRSLNQKTQKRLKRRNLHLKYHSIFLELTKVLASFGTYQSVAFFWNLPKCCLLLELTKVLPSFGIFPLSTASNQYFNTESIHTINPSNI